MSNKLPALPPRPPQVTLGCPYESQTAESFLLQAAYARILELTNHNRLRVELYTGQIAKLEREIRTKDITIKAEQELRMSAEKRVVGLERDIQEARELLVGIPWGDTGTGPDVWYKTQKKWLDRNAERENGS